MKWRLILMDNTTDQFEIAKALLSKCVRYESRDHYFGDREVYWVLEEDDKKTDIADGYFGGGTATVHIMESAVDADLATFHGTQARELAKCGSKTVIGRNDETGPDQYRGA